MTETAKSPEINWAHAPATRYPVNIDYWFVPDAPRPDRLTDVEHPLDEMHRPSNCEYAGMGDHSAENCPAGGV